MSAKIPFRVNSIVNGQYTVVREIGSGGMGTVVAVKTTDGADLALKYCSDPNREAQRRFAREVRIMADINHPNVVNVVDCDFEHDPAFFVMPLASNTLEDEISTLAADESAALDAFEQVCWGIHAIHQANAFHRDIKPANALRLCDGSITVSDLGLAKFYDRDTTTLTQASQFLGTRVYCAPEQLLPAGSRDADARTDVFQLGKTLYHIITGHLPALIDQSQLDKGLAHIVRRTTRDNPDDRYQSVGELMDALANYRAAKDPNQNPRHLIENLLTECTDLAALKQYDHANVIQILDLVAHNDRFNHDTIIDVFERLPPMLLPILPGEFAQELTDALEAYASALDNVVRGYSFSYGEFVAKRMRILFESANDATVKALALEATMIAAHHLHRFAAMEVFNEMLQDVSQDDAVPIVEMLERNRQIYATLAGQVPGDRLVAPLRALRDELVTT